MIQSAVRHVTPPLSSKRHLDAADNLSDQIKSLDDFIELVIDIP